MQHNCSCSSSYQLSATNYKRQTADKQGLQHQRSKNSNKSKSKNYSRHPAATSTSNAQKEPSNKIQEPRANQQPTRTKQGEQGVS
jgi:hypothetical protein